MRKGRQGESSLNSCILSVDGNEATRQSRGEILRRAGYTVSEALSGTEALERLPAEYPDLLLVAADLSDFSGFELCRWVREREAAAANAAPLVILQIASQETASNKSSSYAHISVADAQLTEPVDSNLLLATVRSLLRVREAERKVKLSEQKLRLALTAGRMGTWCWEAENNVVSWSPEMYELLGMDSHTSEPTAKSSMELTHPEDVERVRRTFLEALQNHLPFECEYRVIRPNGTLLWIAVRGLTTYSPRGEPISHTGIAIDVTERRVGEQALRQAEDRFQRLWNANVIGITACDHEKVLESNDVFLQLVGYTREDLIEHRVVFAAITAPEYRERHDRAIRELLERGSCTPYEKEYVRKNGVRVSALVGIVLLQRAPFRCMFFVIDLTEQKALEKKLFEKQNLEKIGLLAGGVAHDFNNLLVGILGNASLAEEMLDEDSPVRETVQEIQRAGERAAHLTRQMLAYSGKGRFIVEALNLSSVARETVELVTHSVSKKVSVRLDLAENIPLVEADIGQLQQIVMNLVLNAAEAIGDREGLILVRTGEQHLQEEFLRGALRGSELDPGQYVCLEVSDSGSGMDEETQARIFEPFFTTKFTGRGLGLAAVDGIVRGHKGAVRVKSTPKVGTTFTVVLPVPQKRTAPPRQAEQPLLQKPHRTETILVVDDEEFVLKTAKFSLERHGYRVLVAQSGKAAVEILKRDTGHVSLAVLDLSMPEMSGMETLVALRMIRPDLEVLISSGYSESESLRLFAGHEISGFVQKPYTATGLVAKVQQRRRNGSDRTIHS